MTKLLLLRHSQSEWNALGKWQGQADPPLTKLGEGQAARAAEKLPDFSVLACSNLERARRTAEIFADSIGWERNKIITESRVKERNAGAFSGLTKTEIEKRFPGFLGNDIWPEDWESDESLIDRLLEGLKSIVSFTCDDRPVVVVTHGGCIYALEALCGKSYERISNLAGRWFSLDGDQIMLGDRMHLLSADEETYPDHI